MNQSSKFNCIKIEKINLWSHVGVLVEERKLGQPFLLDVILWPDINSATKEDKLSQEIKESHWSFKLKTIPAIYIAKDKWEDSIGLIKNWRLIYMK